MSEHLPEPDEDFPDSGREQRDIGGDYMLVVLGLLLALIVLVGSGRL